MWWWEKKGEKETSNFELHCNVCVCICLFYWCESTRRLFDGEPRPATNAKSNMRDWVSINLCSARVWHWIQVSSACVCARWLPCTTDKLQISLTESTKTKKGANYFYFVYYNSFMNNLVVISLTWNTIKWAMVFFFL